MGDREFCVTDKKCNIPPPRDCTELEFQCESGNSGPIKTTSVWCFAALEPDPFPLNFMQALASRRD